MYGSVTLIQPERSDEFARNRRPIPIIEQRDKTECDVHFHETAVARQCQSCVSLRHPEVRTWQRKNEIALQRVSIRHSRISKRVGGVGRDRLPKIFLCLPES